MFVTLHSLVNLDCWADIINQAHTQSNNHADPSQRHFVDEFQHLSLLRDILKSLH
jgi:hypothetical protein